jgi:peptidoglycan/LPS O-acetylase OafA/YrhL
MFFLDFVRTVSLVLIVLYHFNIQIHAQAPTASIVGSMTLLGQMMGDLGVTLFIIISGVALNVSSARWSGAIDFYLKRIMNIFPSFWVAYLVTAVVLFALMGVWPGSGPTWKILLTVTAFDGFLFYRGPNYYLVGEWFLGFILCFYVIFPLLRLTLGRQPLLTWLAIGCLVAVLYQNYDHLFSVQYDRNPLMRLPEFLFGVSTARFVMPHKAAALGISLAVIAVLTSGAPALHPLFYGMVLGPAFFCVLAVVGSIAPTPDMISSIVAMAARYSFLAFLVHHQVIYLLLPRLDVASMSSTRLVLLFVAVLAISFGIAAALNLLVRPLTRALGRVIARARPSIPAYAKNPAN